MFSTDYPHSFCLWPDTQDTIADLSKGITVPLYLTP